METLLSRTPILQRNMVLAASMLFMIIGTGSVYFIVVALKPISLQFDWPRAVPSIAYALQYFAAGFGGILMGYWLDKFGLGVPAFIGATMLGLGSILTCYISNPWHLYAIYGIVMGLLGRSTLFSPLTANITRWFEHNKSRAVGIVGSGQALAGAVWPPIFQSSFASIGWRDTAFWYGIFCLLTMLPLAFILKQTPPKIEEGQREESGKEGSSDSNRSLDLLGLSTLAVQITLAIASVGCCVAMALPLAHMVAHVSDLGYDYETGAQLLALMLATAGISAFLELVFWQTVWRPENNFYFFGYPRFVFIRTHFRGSSLDDLPCRNILRLGLRWSSSLLPRNSERVLAGLPGRQADSTGNTMR
ncbi:MAG: hypothetical protein CM15mP62_28290 [Rhodospirillaceae bacterium]|nr:MAG: hypothetical protein CM15mP62_28290 [Rhodospirillaceae bacterium]